MRGPRCLIGGFVPHQEGHEHGALPLHIHPSLCLVWCWKLCIVELSCSLLSCVGFRSISPLIWSWMGKVFPKFPWFFLSFFADLSDVWDRICFEWIWIKLCAYIRASKESLQVYVRASEKSEVHSFYVQKCRDFHHFFSSFFLGFSDPLASLNTIDHSGSCGCVEGS